MKRLIVMFVASASMLSALFSVNASSEPDPAVPPLRSRCVSMNLQSGTHSSPADPFISFVALPEDSNGDGWFEAVLRMRFRDPLYRRHYSNAVFVVTYADTPSGGVTVNIGDSITDDSGGGDGATQSNDAELYIGRAEPEAARNVEVSGRDGSPGSLAKAENVVNAGDVIRIEVADGRVAFFNKRYPIWSAVESPWLFQLEGQPDTEGPVNYDVFAAFNRVIAGSYRIGAGVGKVKACLF
jgi:hypothetical protein